MTDDDRMIEEAARAFAARDPEFRRMRGLRGQLPSFDDTTWREMAGLGWLGALVPEEQGGSGLTLQQTVLILEQHGRSLDPEPLTAVAVQAALVLRHAGSAAADAKLGALAAGDWLPVVAWQESPGSMGDEPPATRALTAAGQVVLEGRKRFVAVGEAAHAFIVSAKAAEGCGLYLVDRHAAGVAVSTHARVDGGTWCDLALTSVPAEVLVPPARGAAVLAVALDASRIAAAAELVGITAAALDLTVAYLKVRRQFGKLIGSMQALQHRAADLLIKLELARAVVRRSAQLFEHSDDPPARAAAASHAKAAAAEAALFVSKEAMQLHGGISFTDACHVGLYLKRAIVLAAWLGDAASHRLRHGRLVEAGAGSDATGEGADSPLQKEARAFMAQHFPPEWRFPSARMSLRETAPWQAALARKGWLAPAWPAEYGGMGLSAFEQLQFQEEFDRYGIWIAPNGGVTMLGPLLIRYGTEQQRRQYLPAILSGTQQWCQGYSEPEAGSDLASLRTSAVLDGDHFVVNGQKVWTSHAEDADMMFLLARTDPAAKKQEGISFLLADMKTPGITVRRILNIAGESEFCEVFFDNVRIPKANIVGRLNEGWRMAKSLLGSERVATGHPRHAQYPLQLLESVLRRQGQWDDPSLRAQFEALRGEVADISAAYVRTVDALRHTDEVGHEVSILKVAVTETMQRVTDMMLEVTHEAGTLDEAFALGDGFSVHVAKRYFASRPATIFAGSNEIQRNILASFALGLPA